MIFITNLISNIKSKCITYKINKQKKVSLEILDILSILDTNAIVLGGAPRDWYLGKAAKDIDYYLRVKSTEQLLKHLSQHSFNISEIKYKNNIEEINDKYKCAAYLDSIIDVKYKGEKHQIMICSENNYHILKMFPVNISMIAFTIKGYIVPSRDFLKCLETKEIIVSESYDIDHPYVVKIKDKFPDFKFTGGKPKVEIEYIDSTVLDNLLNTKD